MELYLDPVRFTKTSALETTLPEDPSKWGHELLQELYKQVPYVADFSPTLSLTNVDAEQGYGLGHFAIENKSEASEGLDPQQREAVGLRHIRIPVVIKDRKLQPMDILISEDAKALPLTEARLRQALFRPQQFDVTSRTPGDQSMVGQLFPPYRQNFGLGGGGGGMVVGGEKIGSVVAAERDFEGRLRAVFGVTDREISKAHNATKPEDPVRLGDFAGEKRAARRKLAGVGSGNAKPVADAALKLKVKDVIPDQTNKGESKEGATVLDRILQTIYAEDYEKFASALQDRAVAVAYLQNRGATSPALQKLSSAPVIEWRGRMRKLGAIAIKPQVCQLIRESDGYRVKTASTVAWFPESRKLDRKGALSIFGEKVVLAADVAGAITISDISGVADPLEGGENIVQKYGVISSFGSYGVQDLNGKILYGFVIPNLIKMDGEKSSMCLFTNGVQSAVQSTIVGTRSNNGAAQIPRGKPQGYGAFIRVTPEGVEAIEPMFILGTIQEADGKKHIGKTHLGEDATVVVQSGIKQPVPAEHSLLVPEDFEWSPMKENEQVLLQDDPWAMNKMGSAIKETLNIVVRGNSGQFSFDGPPLAKLAYKEKSFLNIDDAEFLLAGLGVDPGYGARKLAEANQGHTPVSIRTGRSIKTAAEAADEARINAESIVSRIPNLKTDLFKEAADIPDATTVDNVLALGFINPENVMTLVEGLPMLEESQTKLCELLLAARIGLTNVSTAALEKCIRGLEQVLDGLKVLAFTGNYGGSQQEQ